MAERISNYGAHADIYRDAPPLDGVRTAAIGGFHCESAEAGAALLRQACDMLAGEGFGAMLGPMDGDTWHTYRVVTWSDDLPPFLLEPTSGPHDLACFMAAGFRPVAEYLSARQSLGAADLGPDYKASGLTLAAWDGTDPEGFFSEVHALSTVAFSANPFYRPLPLEAFLAIYLPLVPLIRPELVLFARADDGALKGFIFAIPDYQQGPTPRDVIFKTYASLRPGAGRLMLEGAVRVWRALGFEHAIYALMHSENRSVDRSRHFDAMPFRRYALMGRRIDG